MSDLKQTDNFLEIKPLSSCKPGDPHSVAVSLIPFAELNFHLFETAVTPWLPEIFQGVGQILLSCKVLL